MRRYSGIGRNKFKKVKVFYVFVLYLHDNGMILTTPHYIEVQGTSSKCIRSLIQAHYDVIAAAAMVSLH